MKERQGSNYAKFSSQTTHTYNKEGTRVGLLLGGGVRQGATVKRIGQYVRNWWRWVRAGGG